MHRRSYSMRIIESRLSLRTRARTPLDSARVASSWLKVEEGRVVSYTVESRDVTRVYQPDSRRPYLITGRRSDVDCTAHGVS